MNLLNKHRPMAFGDLVFANPQLQSDLKAYADGRRGGSLLLHGPYGTGKSVIAETIQRELIAAVGNPLAPQVIEGAEWSSGTQNMVIGHWNLEDRLNVQHPRVILDELDQLEKRQLQVRAMINRYPRFGFIFTTNHLHAIDPGIRSRVDVVEVPMPPPNAWVNRVIAVLDAEGLQVSPDQALRLAEAGHVSIREIGKAMDQLLAVHRATLV